MDDAPAMANDLGALAGLAELALQVHRFQVVASTFGQAYRLLLEARRDGRRRDIRASLVCLDARDDVGPVLRSMHTSIAMSAALRPLRGVCDALGLDSDATTALAAGSPFDAERLHAQVIDWIPVGYAQRERALPALLDLIDATVDARVGHYLVFLPSHAFLTRVADGFASRRQDLAQWRQQRTVPAGVVAQRLDALSAPGHSVGFVITGGVFGEGVDFAGDRLIGAIVIGTGLPGSDAVTELMIEHHGRAGRSGYDVVCRHPALIRVVQSAGRVIRTAHDRGVLLLVDARFADAFHRRWLPSHWRLCRPGSADASRAALQRFWYPETTTPDSPWGESGVSVAARPASPAMPALPHLEGAD